MRVALGTAQWGLNYGITNTKGMPSDKELKLIISKANKNNICVFDTASQYGDSEIRLGNNNLDFEDLLDFFNERIKVQLHEKGIKPGVLNSVSTKNFHGLSLKEMFQRAWAIQDFVANESGKDLIQGYKRALNILTAEEKKDGVEYLLEPKKKLLVEGPELALHLQLQGIDKKVIYDLEKADPKSALLKLATLRQSIDKFFNEVQINSENSIIRRNRLCLLNKIKEVMHLVADFSKIDGDV